MDLTQSQINHIKFTCSWSNMTDEQVASVISLCNMTFVEGRSSGILSMFTETRKNMSEVFPETRQEYEPVPF